MHTIGRVARQYKLLRSTLLYYDCIAALYYDCIAASRARAMDKDSWVQLLRATGLSDDDMDRWHAEFERLAPEAHQDFLESLDIGVREVATIRAQARQNWCSHCPARPTRLPRMPAGITCISLSPLY